MDAVKSLYAALKVSPGLLMFHPVSLTHLNITEF